MDANLDTYKDSNNSLWFDSHSEFSLPDENMGKNVIFGADMSSSVHIIRENVT